MKLFDKCPICGDELITKEVEKLLRGGIHTAVVKVRAEVCLHCGERLYSQETIRRFEQIRDKLKRQEVSEFEQMGMTFRASPVPA
jgi:YgiT-type zinc finger domain-containing protein